VMRPGGGEPADGAVRGLAGISGVHSRPAVPGLGHGESPAPAQAGMQGSCTPCAMRGTEWADEGRGDPN
jgi:hypothetical protein